MKQCVELSDFNTLFRSFVHMSIMTTRVYFKELFPVYIESFSSNPDNKQYGNPH